MEHPWGHWAAPHINREDDYMEMRFMGYRVVQVKHDQIHGNTDNHGFGAEHCYTVLDDFDDPALPGVYQRFWTPEDAINAIALWERLQETIEPPNTAVHEFGIALQYKRAWSLVYTTLLDIGDKHEAVSRLRSMVLAGNAEDAKVARLLHG